MNGKQLAGSGRRVSIGGNSSIKASYRSDISNVLDGRTENAVRKYFQKRIREEKKKEFVNGPIQGNLHTEIIVASRSSPASESGSELLLSDDDIIPEENISTELTPSEILTDEYLSITEKVRFI